MCGAGVEGGMKHVGGCFSYPFVGAAGFFHRVCAAACCSTPGRCVGSIPMLFWSGRWAPPEIGWCGVSMRWCEALHWAPARVCSVLCGRPVRVSPSYFVKAKQVGMSACLPHIVACCCLLVTLLFVCLFALPACFLPQLLLFLI